MTANAASTLRLLITMLKNQGDLMEREHVSDCEKSYLRLWAAAAILKVRRSSRIIDQLNSWGMYESQTISS